MKTFFLGFAAGAATYHFVLGPPNAELISDLRGAIQRLDDKLATAEAEAETPKPEGDSPMTEQA